MFVPLSLYIGHKRKMSLSIGTMFFLALGIHHTPVFAQERSVSKQASNASAKMLIEPEALQKSINDDNLRILDTRSKEEYAKNHIPDAVWVNVAEWQKLTKSERGFHKIKEWAGIIGGLGIDNSSAIVVYGDKLSNTARVWWLLKYAGLNNVKILNGGWPLWTKEKRPANSKTKTFSQTEFVPKFQADRLEELATLKKSVAQGKVKVVDTRSKDEFTGKTIRGKRGGHIPGATHLEWKELVAEDGRFKTPKQLRELFESRGLKPMQTMVCY